jgi:hypothetical protein
MRILLAGVFGGIAMFIWTSIAHMALPLGEAGVKEIPNESTVLNAMRVTRLTFIFFLVSALAKTRRKNEAMKQMAQRIAGKSHSYQNCLKHRLVVSTDAYW